MIQTNGAFSTITSNLQLYWDSTSLSYFKRCPRLYQLSMCALPGPSGYQIRVLNVHLFFGQVYHSALERYDHARVEGLGHELGVYKAIDFALQATWLEGKPWNSDDPNKNRDTLLRTIIWYLDQFGESDPLRTIVLDNDKPAVELSFRMETEFKSNSDEAFYLCGHIDRMVEFQGDYYIADRKTTKTTLSTKYFSQFNPHNQFSLYSIAGKVVYKRSIKGLIVDAAQVAVTFSRFERQLVPRHQEQLSEWYSELGYWFSLAEKCARDSYWPQNDTACDMYGGCPFRPICSNAPAVREQWLKSTFTSRQWDPTIQRGDI